MIKGKKLNEILINDTSKYILNAWNEFTTLTEQEEENLKEIKDFIKRFRTKKKDNKKRKVILWIRGKN